MFEIDRIDLSLASNPVIFFLVLILFAAYAFYVYRYTIPVVSPVKKFLLFFIRTIILILLLFILFEPTITLAKKEILKPVNLFFIDNSRSILIEDGTNRKDKINNFLNDFSSTGLTSISVIYSFGEGVTSFNSDSIQNLNYNEGATNFSKIFSFLENDKRNISSVTIVSDGVITEGSNPVYSAEKLGLPVFTVGIGDTSQKNDIEIKNVLFNEFIYAETPTIISAAIANRGFENKNISLTLLENDKPIEQKNIILSKDGIQNEQFTYTPLTGGEKKLTLIASNLEEEFTSANNRKVFYIDVLSNKIKVLLIAGSPSSDLSFIKNSLQADKNLKVNSITQISSNKFLEENNQNLLIDSADIFFLIGFPSKESPDQLLKKIVNRISEKNIPFFFLFSDGIDPLKFQQMQAELPFILKNYREDFLQVQPEIPGQQIRNPLLQHNSDNISESWNNLPPVQQINSEILPKPESEIIARLKVNNNLINKPLILTRRLGGKRSIAVIAKNIWKWKLQTSQKNNDLFDRFINNSLKWLNSSEEKKQVTIKTSKKIYSAGEEVEFAGQVYDQAFNPVSDAELKVNIAQNDETFEINLSSIGNGLYEGVFQTSETGDYTFSGEANLNGRKIGNDNGKFNIGEMDIEMVNPQMNYRFLNLLSERTGGEFYNSNNYKDLFEMLEDLNQNLSNERIDVSEINLWSDEWLMAIVIFLFAAEWFLRKRDGML